MQYALEPAASEALDDIFVYSRDSWGQEQAERYVQGIFGRLSDIADRKVHWRPILTAPERPASIPSTSVIIFTGGYRRMTG